MIVDRSKAGKKDFHDSFKKDSMSVNVAPRMNGSASEMDIVWDKNILEVIADDGLAGFSLNVYPEEEYTMIQVTGDLQADIYEVK